MADNEMRALGVRVGRKVAAGTSQRIASTAQRSQPGRVDLVDEINRTARVFIEGVGDPLTVPFRGYEPPGIGDDVEVFFFPDGRTRLIPVALHGTASTVLLGDPTLPTTPPSPLARNSDYISKLWTWGHSWTDTYRGSLSYPHEIYNKLFGSLGLSYPHAKNFGVSGGAIMTDWWRVMRVATPAFVNAMGPTCEALFPPQVFLFGTNDVGNNAPPFYESNRLLNQWKMTWRAIFSWFRAGAIYYSNYLNLNAGSGAFETSGVGYGANWSAPDFKTAAGAQQLLDLVTNQRFTIGPTMHTTTVSGSTFDVILPQRYPGTPVTLYFAAKPGAKGTANGTVTYPAGSTTIATFKTDDVVRATPTNSFFTSGNNYGIVAVRIDGALLGGAGDGTTSKVFRVHAGTLAAGHSLHFLGWSIEARYPPLLLPCNVAVSRSWASGGYNTAGIPSNTNGSIAQWACYPQDNSIQHVSGGAALGDGKRYGAEAGVQAADDWVHTYYNPGLVSVAAEFLPAGTIAIPDLETVIHGITNKGLYSPTELGENGWIYIADYNHPNWAGRVAIAKEIREAIDRVALDPLHLMTGFDADELVDAAGER